MSSTVALTLIAVTVLVMVLVTVAGLHYGSEMLSGEDHEGQSHDHDRDGRGGAA